MNETEDRFPIYPPGLWRRIVLRAGPGWTGGALEDDFHHFRIRIDHADGRIRHVDAQSPRTPWTACTGSTSFMAREITGERLSDIAKLDPRQHCTHLYDLAILCAAHAGDKGPTRFDMRVANRVDERTTGTLEQDGIERLRWQLDGTVIVGPERFVGLDIKRVSRWKHDYPADVAEWSTLLRRAVFISGGRNLDKPVGIRAVEMGPSRMGVCFNYQLPQAEQSTPIFDLRDFSETDREPLDGFDPEADFARR